MGLPTTKFNVSTFLSLPMFDADVLFGLLKLGGWHRVTGSVGLPATGPTGPGLQI
jgi:hypothetical protein